MRPLSKKESVAAVAGILNEVYASNNEPEKAIQLSDLILQYNPRDVSAMLTKGSAYYKLAKRNFIGGEYKSLKDMSPEMRTYSEQLLQANLYWGDKAESLGWRQPTKAENAKYLSIVKRVKAEQN